MSDTIPGEILTHLDKALEAEDTTKKNFHIRQAEQLAVRLADDN